MPALLILIAAAAALLALGAIRRAAPRRVPALQAIICLIGLLTALLGPGVTVIELGPTLAVDGLSAIMLAALFLLGASAAAQPTPPRPVLLGALATALLAGDALTLVAAITIALLAARPGRRWIIPLAALILALLALGWHASLPSTRFAAIRTAPPESWRAALVLLATLTAATTLPLALPTLPGALLAIDLLARLLLDLPGPVIPGWWGAPTLALGTLAALLMARRACTSNDLPAAVSATGAAILGLAAAGLGVALLARGADLLPLAATAIAAALLLVITWAVWGGLLITAAASVCATTGTDTLAQLGGLLRRTPATGLALLLALASMAALPLSPGFAAAWLLLQTVLAAGRLGGTGLLALVAGSTAAVGLTLALLAAAALRLAGATLLGPARSPQAAAAIEPKRPIRIAMAALAVATLLLGVEPGLAFALVQPAIQVLTGTAAGGASPWTLAATADAPGYAAPALTILLAAAIALAAWSGRTSTHGTTQPWTGGLPDAGPSAADTLNLTPWPTPRVIARQWRPALTARLVLSTLALALAGALGWAAR